MTTNATGDGPSTSESTADEPTRGKKSVGKTFSSVFGAILLLGCWIFFGVIIFNYLMGIGTPVVLAVLAAIIGGFIAGGIAYLARTVGF